MHTATGIINTSRCCPICGHTSKENRQTQANFECVRCGFGGNADEVGAINVLKRGQAILSAKSVSGWDTPAASVK